jgi:hypothetical protein
MGKVFGGAEVRVICHQWISRCDGSGWDGTLGCGGGDGDDDATAVVAGMVAASKMGVVWVSHWSVGGGRTGW